MKVKVYRNLHNGKLSVMAHNLVIGHADRVTLMSPCFSVMRGGRERCIREGRKNVHAFMHGTLFMVEGFEPYKGRKLSPMVYQHKTDHRYQIEGETIRVTYNPYKYDTFVNADTEKPIIYEGKLALGLACATNGITVQKEFV